MVAGFHIPNAFEEPIPTVTKFAQSGEKNVISLIVGTFKFPQFKYNCEKNTQGLISFVIPKLQVETVNT